MKKYTLEFNLANKSLAKLDNLILIDALRFVRINYNYWFHNKRHDANIIIYGHELYTTILIICFVLFKIGTAITDPL